MEKRLMRLVWNDNNWETPMQRLYDISKSEDHNISFEKRFGYGGEDWLFNPRYQYQGYQYGYIRGVNDLVNNFKFIDEAFLFSINPANKDRLLIAIIKDLEIIEANDKILKQIKPLFKKHRVQAIKELREVGAVTARYEVNHVIPNVRYKLNSIVHYGYDKIVNGIRGNRFNRFKPFIVNNELEELLKLNEIATGEFIFKPGKTKLRKSGKRITSIEERDISNRHTEMSEALYKYLINQEGIDKSNISLEKTYVNKKIIDLVVQKGRKYILYEIKTYTEARKAIREAIGQLLEYSLSDSSVTVSSINIVSPGILTHFDKDLLKQLNKVISIPVHYWEYYFNPDRSGKSFRKY